MAIEYPPGLMAAPARCPGLTGASFGPYGDPPSQQGFKALAEGLTARGGKPFRSLKMEDDWLLVAELAELCAMRIEV